MNKANTTKTLQDAEARVKKFHSGKGAMDKPAVPKRAGVSHGPVNTGPSPRKTTR